MSNERYGALPVYHSFDGRAAYIREINSGYVDLSTHTGDYLVSIPATSKPFKSSKSVKVQVGVSEVKESVTEDIKYERPDGKIGTKREIVGERLVRTDPIHEMRTTNDTPDFQPLGKSIQAGDAVIVQRQGSKVRGILETLNPVFVQVDGVLYFWNQNQTLITRS